jgi:lipoprotein-releasing system permease protein
MYELFLARRYLLPRRRRGFLSLITWIAVGGVTLGVLALIVVLAVMSGFEREVKTRIVGTNAHLAILPYGTQGMGNADSLLVRIRAHPEVVAAAPFVYGKAMISARGSTDGIVVKGVDLDDESSVTRILDYIERPPGPFTLAAPPGGLPGVVLGVHVAENLSVTTGERVQLLAPQVGASSPLGYLPRVRNYQVAGIFRSGMYEFDASFVFLGLHEAQDLLNLGDRISAVEAKVRDMYRAPQVAAEIVGRLGGFPYRATDWIEMNAQLFSWMQMEKRVMFIILTLIVMVAAFNILASLVLLVMEKRRDIGILRSMGATPGEIATVFILQGVIIGWVGMALGAAGGLTLCHLLDKYKFIRLPGDIYFIDTLPVRVEAGDVAAVLLSVLVISVLATIYPAVKAARLRPVEAIRNAE